MQRGTLFIISGPSGSGKDTLVAELLKMERMYYSVSATTREPRPGEIDGKDYHFIPKEAFEGLLKANGLLEHTEYCGEYYGTLTQPIAEQLEAGNNVLLILDVHGAATVMQKCPNAMSIFLIPPSLEVLEARLRKRGTEAENELKKRLARVSDEVKEAQRYDYILINDDILTTVINAKSIIKATELKGNRQTQAVNSFIYNK